MEAEGILMLFVANEFLWCKFTEIAAKMVLLDRRISDLMGLLNEKELLAESF